MDQRSKTSNLAKDIYLIAGSASEENIRLLLKKKFNLDKYDPFIHEYDLNNNIRVVVNCNFHKSKFSLNDFSRVCNEIRSNLKEIICLENLNPRPETMLQNMKILRYVFTSNELKSLLVICFTSSKQLNLKEIHKDAKGFNVLFHDILKIQSDSQKDDYIIKNIKTLDTLRPISFIKSKTNTKIIQNNYTIKGDNRAIKEMEIKTYKKASDLYKAPDTNQNIQFISNNQTKQSLNNELKFPNKHNQSLLFENNLNLQNKRPGSMTKEDTNSEIEKKIEIYLIAGSASEDNISLLLKKKFGLDNYNPSINKYDLNNNIRVVVNCNFHRYNFDFDDFSRVCNEIRSDLKQIICLENLNPRPETMLQDMKILRYVFTSNELKSLLVICFTSSNPLDLQQIQKDATNLSFLFDYTLNIQSDSQKYDYIMKNIKILHSIEPISFNKRNTTNNIHDNYSINDIGIRNSSGVGSNSSIRVSSPENPVNLLPQPLVQMNHTNNDPQKQNQTSIKKFPYQDQTPFDSNRLHDIDFSNKKYPTSNVNGYNIHTVRVKRPNKYDGTTDIDEFIQEFENYANDNEWNDYTKANMLKLYLEKEAVHAWNNMPDCQKGSIKEIYYNFRKEVYLFKFENHTPKNNQNVRVFADEIKELFIKATSPDSTSSVVVDYHIKKKLISCLPGNLSEILSKFEKKISFDQLIEAVEKYMPVFKFRNENEPMQSNKIYNDQQNYPKQHIDYAQPFVTADQLYIKHGQRLLDIEPSSKKEYYKSKSSVKNFINFNELMRVDMTYSKGSQRLKLNTLIDTGVSCNFIKLSALPEYFRYSIRSNEIECYVQLDNWYGLDKFYVTDEIDEDAIVGLGFLHKHSFTIDFAKKEIIFGANLTSRF